MKQPRSPQRQQEPQGHRTDGVHLWVVNDTTTDKVFKYTLTGGLVRSWTLSGGGGAPTGITLDPTNVAHLWIVDNATDRVYQYDNAAGLTSGSQAASISFALAAGNTNPQDIADPPAPGTPALIDTGDDYPHEDGIVAERRWPNPAAPSYPDGPSTRPSPASSGCRPWRN